MKPNVKGSAWLGWVARGILMGIADMVPGVSGGTMALLTGIYDRLINALSSFDLTVLGLLWRRDIRAAWRHVDATFLSCLLAGILAALVAMSHVVVWFMTHQPVLLWGFFLGLLGAALCTLMADVVWQKQHVLAMLGGALLALTTAFASGAALEPTPIWFFFGGMIAISAMILPGISGSLILLLLGLYLPAVEAIRQFDVGVILVIGGGCATGILLFSRLLRWFMTQHRMLTMAALSGVVLGAMPRLWPWQVAEEGVVELSLRLPDSTASLITGTMAIIVGVLVYAGIRWMLQNSDEAL
ncbi:MAG: DUF368 domain-containing protein [Natronospirillum sp.]